MSRSVSPSQRLATTNSPPPTEDPYSPVDVPGARLRGLLLNAARDESERPERLAVVVDRVDYHRQCAP